MTAVEMKYDFNVRVDVLSGSTAYGLTDKEINTFLNVAQDKVIEETFKNSGSSLLTELLDTFTSSSSAAYIGISNAQRFTWSTLTDDLFLMIDARVQIVRTNPTISGWLGCEQIAKQKVHNFAETTFNKPWFEEPKYFLENDSVIVVRDGYSSNPTSLRIDYIKRPTAIDVTTGAEVNCALREVLHDKIVETAAKLAVNDHDYMPDRRLRDRQQFIDNER